MATTNDDENRMSMFPGHQTLGDVTESILLEDGKHTIRVFCVTCERRAEIIKLGEREAWMRFLHVKCHGEELICWLPDVVTRRAIATTRDGMHVDLLWNDLHAIDTLDRLDHAISRIDEDIAKCDDMISLEQPPETDAHLRKARAERQVLRDAMTSVRRNLLERREAAAKLVGLGVLSPDDVKEPRT